MSYESTDTRSDTEITDQQIARRSKLPLKVLRQNPEFMEGFRKYLVSAAHVRADGKKAAALLRAAKASRANGDIDNLRSFAAATTVKAMESYEILAGLTWPSRD
jgi:hypothetical protein